MVQRLVALNPQKEHAPVDLGGECRAPFAGMQLYPTPEGIVTRVSNALVPRLSANPRAGGTYDGARPEPYFPSLAPPSLACNLQSDPQQKEITACKASARSRPLCCPCPSQVLPLRSAPPRRAPAAVTSLEPARTSLPLVEGMRPLPPSLLESLGDE